MFRVCCIFVKVKHGYRVVVKHCEGVYVLLQLLIGEAFLADKENGLVLVPRYT